MNAGPDIFFDDTLHAAHLFARHHAHSHGEDQAHTHAHSHGQGHAHPHEHGECSKPCDTPSHSCPRKNLTGEPLKHYSAIYSKLDPATIASRTGLSWDAASSSFSFCLAGFTYQASWPSFTMKSSGGHPDGGDYEQILMLRYLTEGSFVPATGKEINYREIPKAQIYEKSFNGRVCMRLLKEFGNNLQALQAIMETYGDFNARPLQKCDLGYQFDLLNGLPMSLRFWRGDDEFQPTVSVLFDSSFQFAFSAEDLAVAGGILIDHLVRLRDQA